jgi:hypothetical protein
MNLSDKQTIGLLLLGAATLLAIGCKTTVRENVISTIDTGFGATIAENKQTQIPEIKVGYIRSQFYSVPTGKVVENQKIKTKAADGKSAEVIGDHQTNAANLTPEMVAGIRVHSSWSTGLFGADISESFALGEAAVKSQAAIAMYVASAEDKDVAKAAADAVKGTDSAEKIAAYLNNANHQTAVANLKDLRSKKLTSAQKANGQDFNVGDSASAYADALATEKGDTIFNIQNKPSHAADLQDIITKLQSATQ